MYEGEINANSEENKDSPSSVHQCTPLNSPAVTAQPARAAEARGREGQGSKGAQRTSEEQVRHSLRCGRITTPVGPKHQPSVTSREAGGSATAPQSNGSSGRGSSPLQAKEACDRKKPEAVATSQKPDSSPEKTGPDHGLPRVEPSTKEHAPPKDPATEVYSPGRSPARKSRHGASRPYPSACRFTLAQNEAEGQPHKGLIAEASTREHTPPTG